RAVVRRVGLHVEQANAGGGRERRAEGLDGRVISTCGEVRHALDEGGGHGRTSTRNAEVGMRNREARVGSDDRLAVPRSAFRVPHSHAFLSNSISQACNARFPATTEPCRSTSSGPATSVLITPASR